MPGGGASISHSSSGKYLLGTSKADSLRPSHSSNDLNSSSDHASAARGLDINGGKGEHQSRSRKHSADEIHGSIFNLRKFCRDKKKCQQQGGGVSKSSGGGGSSLVLSVKDAVVTGPQEAVYCPLLLINGNNPGSNSPIKAALNSLNASNGNLSCSSSNNYQQQDNNVSSFFVQRKSSNPILIESSDAYAFVGGF